MERIKKIFRSLSKTEIRYVKKYLGAFHNKGSNKALEMLHILEKHPDITQDEISKKLYNDPKSKAFIMLKGRVLEKMLETLSLSINFHNNPTFKDDPVAYGSIDIMKELTHAVMLKKRGLPDLSKEILEKCLKKAIDLHLPEFQMQALVYLQNITTSERELNEYMESLWNANEMYAADLKGISMLNTYRVNLSDSATKGSSVNDSLEDQLDELKIVLDKHYSIRAHYYYLYLRGNLYDLKNEYQKSKKVLEEMIQLFQNAKGLQSKNRMVTPHIQLSVLELSRGEFGNAKKAASNAMQIAPTNTLNYITALLYRFIACLYLGDREEGEYLSSLLNSLEYLSKRQHLQEVGYYLMSCHKYLNRNYTEATRLFHQIEGLFSDKGNWNIGLRIYEILLLIDMHKLDVASSKIETLRKHISRYEPTARAKLIYKYLYLLEKNSFHFDQESSAQQQIILELKKADSWEPLSDEIIKFDVWVDAKKNRVPLNKVLKKRLSAPHLVNN